MASITLLSVDGEPVTQSNLYYADTVEISGFLGAFSVNVESHGKRVNLAQAAIGGNTFDIVLDMSLNGLMSEEVPVPGYFPVGPGYPKLADALGEIPTLMGTFDNPKYFRLDPDLCAHSSRGVNGVNAVWMHVLLARSPVKVLIKLAIAFKLTLICVRASEPARPLARRKRFTTHCLILPIRKIY